MKFLSKKLLLNFVLFINFFSYSVLFADNHDVNEILNKIQNDIKTLERAVYSGSINLSDKNNTTASSSTNNNSEDVLTRHLLKLSEIEKQFQQLTNKFEEINFKLDKLSNRLSKVQADNQVRFQDIESNISNDENIKKVLRKVMMKKMKYYLEVLNLKT